MLESEKIAVAALDVLRKRTLYDQPVRARLKNESYLRNLMKELNVPEANAMPGFMPMMGQPMMMGFNGQPMMMGFPQNPMFPAVAPVYSERYFYDYLAIIIHSKPKKNRKGKGGKKHDNHNRGNVQPKILPALQNASVFPPLVPTAAPRVGTIDIHYTPSEIESIVKEVKDLTCPPLATENVDDVVRVLGECDP